MLERSPVHYTPLIIIQTAESFNKSLFQTKLNGRY